jgi:RNA polymerase sigma-70 factor, ECF subfamily
MRELDDEALVGRYRETREKNLFAELFRRHKRSVFLRCRVAVRNTATAEDLTQQTFLQALEHVDQFQGGNFRAWLATIAKHLCVRHLRSAAVARETSSDSDLDELVGIDNRSNVQEDNRVLTILKELSEPQRICLKLAYVDECRHKQIPALTGYSPNAVKSHIQNGARRFRNLWNERYGKREVK